MTGPGESAARLSGKICRRLAERSLAGSRPCKPVANDSKCLQIFGSVVKQSYAGWLCDTVRIFKCCVPFPDVEMQYLKELKILRGKVPVPASEGLSLLRQFHGDIDLSERAFRIAAINTICEQAGCTMIAAEQALVYMKMDIAKAVSHLLAQQEKQNYTRPDHLTRKHLDLIDEWIKNNYNDSFIGGAPDEVITALNLLPGLETLKAAITEARERRQAILQDIDYHSDEHKYFKRWSILNKDPVSRECEKVINENISYLERELSRHYRHLS